MAFARKAALISNSFVHPGLTPKISKGDLPLELELGLAPAEWKRQRFRLRGSRRYKQKEERYEHDNEEDDVAEEEKEGGGVDWASLRSIRDAVLLGRDRVCGVFCGGCSVSLLLCLCGV